MEAIVGGGGGGGGGEGDDGGSIDGSSSGGSVSTLSKEELAVEQRKSNKINNVGLSNFEVSSYPDDQDDELELGLGLSLGVGGSCSKGGVVASKQHQAPRILTAKDLASRISLSMPSSARPINGNSSTASPSSASSSSSIGGRVHNDNKGSIGTKRTADSVNSPSGASGQAVGWPPVGAYRMNSMANQTKTIGTGEVIAKVDQSQGKGVVYGASTNDIKGDAANRGETGGGHLKGSLFVKVNMYGVGIGRKVDLSAHSSYESLGRKLEEMFNIPTRTVGNLDGEEHGTICSAVAPSELLDGSSEFVLTYEDKDGDWMLVGDVPWGMFLSSVKRLRIMKTSEARGLAPRCEERNAKQRTRLV